MTIAKLAPERLHVSLLGKDPSEEQLAFYNSAKVGFSDKAFHEDRFEAIALLTIQKTMRNALFRPERVALLVPPTHDKWVLEHFNAFHREMYNNFKKMKGDRITLANAIGECFKKVLVGGKGLLQMPEGAIATTAFGWVTADPIPEWLRQNLFLV